MQGPSIIFKRVKRRAVIYLVSAVVTGGRAVHYQVRLFSNTLEYCGDYENGTLSRSGLLT